MFDPLSTEKQITNYKAVDIFLSSISRNSLKSKHTYQIALTHFQKFLKQKHMQHDIEIILKRLSKNELDIYVILDEFVSYLTNEVSTLASNTIKLNTDYSEWFLGHNKSPYYTKKEAERREIYATKCMNYLTFLDYTTLEATGKNIEDKLSEKEKEIQLLRQRDSVNTDAIANLSDQVMKLMAEVNEMKQRN